MRSALLRLLSRCGVDESLVGDVLEQYRAGESIVWLWRELLIALVVHAARAIHTHKLLAARAVVTGWISLWALGAIVQRTEAATWLQDRIALAGFASMAAFWADYGLGFHLFASVVFAGSGWIVSRLSATHQAASVLAFFASIPLLSFPVYVERVRHLIADGVNTHGAVIDVFTFALLPLCALLGGLSGIRLQTGRQHSVKA